jgi:hypothetical protein
VSKQIEDKANCSGATLDQPRGIAGGRELAEAPQSCADLNGCSNSCSREAQGDQL